MSEGVTLLAAKESTNPLGELKEFDKLDLLLSQIPKKAQHGLLKSCDLVLTCIDANSLFIALGSNVGIIFLWSRTDQSMQRFKSASTNDVITCVRLHHGIDDQLAFATASGDLTVYCIPGVTSMHRRQVQKFEVKDIHHHYVTCLEWSTNGMKFYSADKAGLVATTEVDAYQGQCMSSVLLMEPTMEIVQLDYKHKILLVSTNQRNFIVRLDQKCQVVNIGTQDRKKPGPFGACLIPDVCKTNDAKLYAARPGCRLWLSDVNGVVLNTHIFSDPLSSAVPEIPLLSAGKLQIGQSDFQFGNLKSFRQKEVVTWSNYALVVLDPDANRVVARQGRLNGIVGVAVVDDTEEIFLLRKHAEARVIRIAATAESKIAKVDLLPVAKEDKPEHTDDKGKENPAQAFFKMLTQPLKHLDKTILLDFKQEPEMPAPVSMVTSPDLPPVVTLTSPELENLRMFTGEIQTSELSVSHGKAKDSTDGNNISSGEASTNLSVTIETSSSTSSSISVPGPESFSLPGQQAQNTTVTQNSEEDSIVFSHKMKKHKKKRGKDGLLGSKLKEDDNISLKSVSSQLSEDNILSDSTTSASATVTSSSDAVSSSNSSVISTLQRADDMLMLVDILLNPGSHCVKPASDLNNTEISDVAGIHLSQVDPSVLNQKSPITSANTETTNNSLENKNITLDFKSKEVCEETEIKHDIVARVISIKEDKEDSFNDASVSIYETSSDGTKSIKTSQLSECDQHLDSAREQKDIKTTNVETNVGEDYSTIIEKAIENVTKTTTSNFDPDNHDNDGSSSSVQSVSAKSKFVYQNSFQDIYSEIDVIESTDPFHKGYKKDPSVDDFYSLFLDTSPESPVSPIGKAKAPFAQQTIPPPSDPVRSSEMQDVSERRLVNTFSEIVTPANIYSLSLSNSHVWFTDKSENIYYSSLSNPKGIQWRKASGQANQISVSPSGHIVWRLHRGVVYAGTKISSRHPEGLKWVEAVRDVATISVDNDCAWFVMYNGEVMMQRRLSQERPCYKSQKVECPHKLKYIIARWGVVWAVTDALCLLVRMGVSDETPEGTEWELDTREEPPYLFSHVALDNESIGWALDVLGQVWFCDGVNRSQPLGRRLWWQVPMSEYILHDTSTLDMIKGLAKKLDPKKLSYILSNNRGGLVIAGMYGVLLCMDFRNIIQVCQGNIQGYHWLEAQPVHMSPSSSWKQVCAQIAHLEWGLLWAQHSNGDVFTFKHAKAETIVIPDCSDFCCIAVGPTAVWALNNSGAIYVRTGMGPLCPQGISWVELDISQLGDAHIVHLSCNSLYVWAVEAVGTVYQRIGAKPPSDNNLSPAWLAIDTFAVIVFTRVYTGPLDWMVWAIDNGRLTYVRAGITENMPIGQEWVNVPGIQAVDLALTRTGVWALTPSGEIFFRYGIARDRPCGNYWKKIPGSFSKISASANDELWGINTDGQLMQCNVKYLTRHQDSNDPIIPAAPSRSSNSVSEDIDWEIV